MHFLISYLIKSLFQSSEIDIIVPILKIRKLREAGKIKRLALNYSPNKVAEQDLIQELGNLKVCACSIPPFCLITGKVKLKPQN